MKRSFVIENLGCAHCAAKMERSVSALPGVNSCSVNFLTSKMTIDADDDKMDDIFASAAKIVKKFEPNAALKA